MTWAVASLVIALFAAISGAQTPRSADAKPTNTPVLDAPAYETQQRARRLLQMDAEIKSLPDVEIRCQLRFNILEFVYSKDASSEYGTAEPILIAFFEEMAANEKQLASRTIYWGNAMALLLRKHAPETAKKIEAKYVHEVDTSGEDYEAMRSGGNVDEIIDRAIARLQTDKGWGNFLNTYERARRGDQRAAERMTEAALDFAEKHPGPQQASMLYRIFDAVLNPPASPQTPENVLRYYRCLVAGARIEVAKAEPGVYVSTLWPLRRALPKMKQLDQQLYADGQSVVAQYRKSLSKDGLAKEQADDRIEASDDKLEQAIAEAEAAGTQSLKNYLWGRASQLAVIQGSYKRAVELIMKADPDLGYKDRPNARDEDMWYRIANPATNKKDYDAAASAISQIKDDGLRASAMLQLGYEMGRWTIPRDRAVTVIFNALDLMDMATPPPDSICWIGNARHLLTMSKPTLTLDEFTARAIRMVNRIPTPGADAKAGTPERAEFVMKTLNRAMGCVAYLFRPVMDSTPRPDAALVDQIKIREWRLAAKIQAESSRRYPMNQ